MDLNMGIIYIVAGIVLFVVGLYWLFLPFLLLGRMDRIFQSIEALNEKTERVNKNLEALMDGVEEYINGPPKKTPVIKK